MLSWKRKSPAEFWTALERLEGVEQEARLGLVTAFLDAHSVHGLEGVAQAAVRPLFKAWFPEVSLEGTLDALNAAGIVEKGTDGAWRVPPDIRGHLGMELGRRLLSRPVQVSSGDLPLLDLLQGFEAYAAERELAGAPRSAPWGGMARDSAGRGHVIVVRPCLLYLEAPARHYLLALCAWPHEDGSMAEAFARGPGLRQRLALFDLARTEKINLTHSDVFVHFERYLARRHGLRLRPSPRLGRALEETGILSMRMG